MTQTLDGAIDGARLVRSRPIERWTVILAVWHGGHTVNSYTYNPADVAGTFESLSVRSVGDFETGETTREDAEDAMTDLLTMPHERD